MSSSLARRRAGWSRRLAMIGVSARAWAATEKATLPRFYWDLRTARKSLEKGQTPYTPPVSLYFGLTWLWG